MLITWFWRTHAQQEIDYIEDRNGILHAFEFKWNENRKHKMPASFASAYPGYHFEVITPGNYIQFLQPFAKR